MAVFCHLQSQCVSSGKAIYNLNRSCGLDVEIQSTLAQDIIPYYYKYAITVNLKRWAFFWWVVFFFFLIRGGGFCLE